MNNTEDKKIKDALLSKTDDIVGMKDEIWKNLEKELNLKESKVINMQPKNSQKRSNKFMSKLAIYGSVAAAVFIIALTNTSVGQATVDKISKMFAPNKTIEQPIEGTQEKNNLSLKVSPMRYVIYIDKERYTLTNTGNKDIITPKIKADNYPEVFMEIEQILDQNPEAVASKITNDLKIDFNKVENLGIVADPIKGINIHATNGSEWNSTVVNYYLVDNTKGGTFIIKQQYFLEAAEGHGARFHNMLKEFEIIKE